MDNLFRVGEKVHAVSSGPFKGLGGIIQTVDTISSRSDEPFCFYLVDLELAHLQEPIWFEREEVELASPYQSDCLSSM